jgi:hypothetical protein
MFTRLVLNKIEGKSPDESFLPRGKTAMSTTCVPGWSAFRKKEIRCQTVLRTPFKGRKTKSTVRDPMNCVLAVIGKEM